MSQVSVIIPSYNSASYLAEAIQSVLDQTFSDFEIIIIDDGSTDHTPETVREFSDSRIHYIWQANKGISGARNTGIRAAQGTYVAFLDADDWFLPQKLARQIQFLEAHPEIGCVAGGWIETDARGQPRQTVEPWRHFPGLDLVNCVKTVPLIPSAIMIRRSWLEKIGLFDESMRWVEDYDLWLRLLMEGCRFSWLPHIVCRYRIHDKGISYNWQPMRDGHLTALDKLYGRPDLPPEILGLRSQAYAMAHAFAAARAYGAGAVDAAQQEIIEAIRLAPNLAENNPCAVVNLLVGWDKNYYLLGEDCYYNLLEHNLPPQIPFGKWQVRKALSSRHIATVFAAYHNAKPETVWRFLVKGLRLYPPWIFNRGIIAIALNTLLPKYR